MNSMNIVLIWSLVILTFMNGCTPEKELYIIPNNYKGKIVIIFNIKDGDPRTYENGYRIYRIPENGVLFTQFSSNTGESPIGDIQYRYVRGTDTIKIKEHLITGDTSSTLQQIFALTTGIFGDKKRYEYISFTICTYKEWTNNLKDKSRFLDDDKRIWEIIQKRLSVSVSE